MKPTRPLAVLASSLLLLAATAGWSGAAVIFSDSFDNGTPANSDSTTGFWSQILTANGPGSANALVESGGVLSLSAGENDGSNANNFSGVSMASSVTSDFNFFTTTLTFQVRGISFSGNTTVGTKRLYFGLISDGNSSFSSDDNVIVRVLDDGTVRLGYKQDTPSNGSLGPNQAALLPTVGVNAVTGFDLTLGPGDAANEIDYVLTAFGGSGASSSGSFTFDVADWNGAGGNSALMIWAQEGNVSGGTENFTVTLDSVTVIPEPGSAAIIGMAGVMLFLFRRRA